MLRRLAERLEEGGEDYAATGLGAAWLLTRFAGSRIASIYLAEQPSAELMARLGFREVDRGANVWLVVPNDVGVFQGASEQEGVR